MFVGKKYLLQQSERGLSHSKRYREATRNLRHSECLTLSREGTRKLRQGFDASRAALGGVPSAALGTESAGVNSEKRFF